MKRFALVVLALGLSLAAHAQESRTLTVLAASSLTNAFEEIAVDFEAANPGVDVVFSFASSSDLAAQLAAGAPADVFASANQRQMQVARNAGRTGATPRIFARNRLVLLLPLDNPAGIESLADLSQAGVKLVLAAPGVPVRDYTETVLNRLAADPAYGEAYRMAVLANVVSEEQNVRQVAAKIALGEADAGFVYASDVTPDISAQVTSIAIPDALNTIARYPIAITNDASDPALAQAFVDYVLAAAGQNRLVCWGFIGVRPGQAACQR